MTPLADLARLLRGAFKRYHAAPEEMIEATLDLARLLREAKEHFPSHQDFGSWLALNDLDEVTKDDRAALVNIAEHPDLYRDVMASTGRSSVRLVWRDEMQPRLRSIAKTEPTPTHDENPAPIIDENADREVAPEEKSEVSLPDPEPVGANARTMARSPMGKLPDAEVVLGHLLSPQTRSKLGSVVAQRGHGRAVWDLLVESVKSGAFGPPTNADISKPGKTLRLILPWAPSGYAQRFDLLDPAIRTQIRQDILPLVRDNRRVFELNPERLPEMVIAAARARREDVIRTQEIKQRKAAVSALPTIEREVLVYGYPLWPTSGSKWTYQDALEAAWFFRILVNALGRFLGSPANLEMTINMFLRWTPMRDSGWAEAVRKIGWAYTQQPEGACEIPPAPTNYGM